MLTSSANKQVNECIKDIECNMSTNILQLTRKEIYSDRASFFNHNEEVRNLGFSLDAYLHFANHIIRISNTAIC